MDPPLLPKPELHVLSIDEVTEIAKKCIKNICINEDTGEYEKYIPEVYSNKTKELTAHILQTLTDESPISKYVVNVIMIQNNGCGVHANTGAHWCDKDFFITVPYTNDEIHAIVSISSIYLNPNPDELVTNLDE